MNPATFYGYVSMQIHDLSQTAFQYGQPVDFAKFFDHPTDAFNMGVGIYREQSLQRQLPELNISANGDPTLGAPKSATVRRLRGHVCIARCRSRYLHGLPPPSRLRSDSGPSEGSSRATPIRARSGLGSEISRLAHARTTIRKFPLGFPRSIQRDVASTQTGIRHGGLTHHQSRRSLVSVFSLRAHRTGVPVLLRQSMERIAGSSMRGRSRLCTSPCGPVGPIENRDRPCSLFHPTH